MGERAGVVAPRSSAGESTKRWLAARRPAWGRIATEAKTAGAPMSPAEASQRIRDYRDLARDLAIARRELAGSGVAARLESLLHGLHLELYREYLPAGEAFRQLYAERVPAALRGLRGALGIVVSVFLFFGGAAAALVAAYPELAGVFASERMVASVEHGSLWTDDVFGVAPASVVSVNIIVNNVIVSLSSFVFGALYGIGTLYMVALNGAMLGALFVFTAQHGAALRLLSFIVPHGVVELSVILIAAAAGLRLGEALARPGSRTRSEAFNAAIAQAGVLLAVVVPALFVAGTIEGFVSPNPDLGWWPRGLVGCASGFLLWAALTGRFFRRRAASPGVRPASAPAIPGTA